MFHTLHHPFRWKSYIWSLCKITKRLSSTSRIAWMALFLCSCEQTAWYIHTTLGHKLINDLNRSSSEQNNYLHQNWNACQNIPEPERFQEDCSDKRHKSADRRGQGRPQLLSRDINPTNPKGPLDNYRKRAPAFQKEQPAIMTVCDFDY